MSRCFAIAAAAAAAIVAAVPSTARAQRGDTALILSFVGRGGADLAPYLKPVADALPQLAPKWDVELRRRIDATFGESPRALELEKLEAIKVRTERIEQGILLGEGSVNASIQQLEGYRRALVDAQGSLALDPQAKDLYFRVLLTLATAYQIKDHPSPKQSAERMAELVDAFPDLPTGAMLSPSMRELYDRTRETAEKQRRIVLRIDRNSSPSAKAFVNGRVVPCVSWSCTVHVVPNASCAVFMSTPSGDSRMHKINMGDLDSTFTPDIPFEVALSSERYVGFRFDDAASQGKNEARFVDKLAKAMNFKTVLVLSQFTDGNQAGVRLKAWESGKGIAAASVGMLGGVFTPAQASELARRVAEQLNPQKTSSPASSTRPPPPASSTTRPPPAVAAPASSTRPPPLASAGPGLKDGTYALPNGAGTVTLKSQPAPRERPKVYDDAWDAYLKGKYPEALRLFDDYIRTETEDDEKAQARIEEAWSMEGSIYCRQKKRARVLAALKHVTDAENRGVIRDVCQQNKIALPADPAPAKPAPPSISPAKAPSSTTPAKAPSSTAPASSTTPAKVAAMAPAKVAAMAPAKAAAPDLTRTVEQLNEDARGHYIAQRYMTAIVIADEILRRGNEDQKAAARRLKAAAYCMQGPDNRAQVLPLYSELDEQGRSFIKYVCSRNGITLP